MISLRSILFSITILWGLCWPIKSTASDIGASCDYLIIYDTAFEVEKDRLVARRTAQGYRTCAVTTSEVAANYGGGNLTAESIRLLLLDAFSNWEILPTYIMLLGRDEVAAGEQGNIPVTTQTFSHWYADSSCSMDWPNINHSDSYFVRGLSSCSNKPLAHIGRLPATTVDSGSPINLQRLVDKILEYETRPYESWMSNGHFFVGDSQTTGESLDHIRALADNLHTDVLSAIGAFPISRFTDLPDQEDRTQLFADSWNSGLGMLIAYGQTVGAVQNLTYHFNFGVEDFLSWCTSNATPILFGGSCKFSFARGVDGGGVPYPTPLTNSLLFSSPDVGAAGILGAVDYTPDIEGEYMLRLMCEEIVLGTRLLGQILTNARVRAIYDGNYQPAQDFLSLAWRPRY